LLHLIALGLMAGLLGQATQARPGTDQTLPVTKGARLVVNMFAGELTIHSWDRDAIRVRGEHSSRDHIDIRPSDSVVTVKPVSSMGAPRSVDMEITVPTWMKIDVSGTYADVTIDGSQAEISVETVRGDVNVKGGAGFVSLKSVEGLVSLENANGRVNIRSVNEGVSATNVSGDVIAETVNGDVALSRIQSASVDVSTVNGDVSYDGPIKDNGIYQLTTHNGDIIMSVAENVNATISVRTFNGEFVAGFPVKVQDSSGRNKRFNLVIGSGNARVDLESFGGTIELQRPGAARSRNREKHERDHDDEKEPN
jgi:hypothetical protein